LKILLVSFVDGEFAPMLAAQLGQSGFRVEALCSPNHVLACSNACNSVYLRFWRSTTNIRRAIEASGPTLLIPCDDFARYGLTSLHRICMSDGDPASPKTVAPGTFVFSTEHQAPSTKHSAPSTYSVTWWDPRALGLGAVSSFGLRRDDLIVRDGDMFAVEDRLADYERWREERASVIAAGARPSVRFQTATAWAAEAAKLGIDEAILSVLHEAGWSWQQTRSWCDTGTVLRQRKAGVVTVTDPATDEKKSS